MQPSTHTLEYEPDVVGRVTAPLRALRPPGRREFAAAHRQGRDLSELIAEFWNRHEVAFAETEQLVDEVEGVARWQLWDEVFAYIAAQDYAWRVVPVMIAARVKDSGIQQHELARVHRKIRDGGTIVAEIVATPRRRAARPPRAGRVVVRRRSRSVGTATRIRDPDDGDPEPDLGRSHRRSELRHISAVLAAWLEGVER
jgi:hypothetical protein